MIAHYTGTALLKLFKKTHKISIIILHDTLKLCSARSAFSRCVHPHLLLQVSCQSDLEVAKYDGFWGQGSVPRGPILAGEIMQAPLLGELEYVMDAKERRKSTPKRD